MRSTILAILAIVSLTQATANNDTEPNTDWQDALALPQGRTVAGTQSDDDWYLINAPTGDRIVVDLTFTHAEGDIDMRLYDDKEPTLDSVPGSPRAESTTHDSDHEFIVVSDDPGTYFIRVIGANAGNSYTLTWTELPSPPADDGFEENDSSAAAKFIAESVVAFGSQSDEDWYSIEIAPGNERVLASLRFRKAYPTTTNWGDLDLFLYDGDGNLIDESANPDRGVNEALNVNLIDEGYAEGTYYLLVDGDDTGDAHALNWAGVSPASTTAFPVPAANEPPQAITNTVTTLVNTAYHFALTDFTYHDAEGDSLVSAVLSTLSLGGGTLTHSDGIAVNDTDTLSAALLATLVYTPPTDSIGSPMATFDFTVNDLNMGTVTAQMNINVISATPLPPDEPEVPDEPVTPEVPDEPVTPEAPDEPITSEVPDDPVTPEAPVADESVTTDTSSSSGAFGPVWLFSLLLALIFRNKWVSRKIK